MLFSMRRKSTFCICLKGQYLDTIREATVERKGSEGMSVHATSLLHSPQPEGLSANLSICVSKTLVGKIRVNRNEITLKMHLKELNVEEEEINIAWKCCNILTNAIHIVCFFPFLLCHKHPFSRIHREGY